MLRLKNITKDYGGAGNTVHALKGISLDFRKNEFVSILGQSGCGKTTLLNIIGGLDKYTSGDLEICGVSTKNFTDGDWDVYRNHRIGFVFQSYNLIPHQTILGNVEIALTIAGVSKAERKKRAAEALKRVGLEKEMNKKPNQLSRRADAARGDCACAGKQSRNIACRRADGGAGQRDERTDNGTDPRNCGRTAGDYGYAQPGTGGKVFFAHRAAFRRARGIRFQPVRRGRGAERSAGSGESEKSDGRRNFAETGGVPRGKESEEKTRRKEAGKSGDVVRDVAGAFGAES